MKSTCFSLIMLLLIISSYGKSPNTGEKNLHIVASNSVIGDWVNQIANNRINLAVLVGPDTDNHTFEPTPQDAIKIGNADIIFENGLGLEYWLTPLYNSSESKAKRVPLSDNLPNLLPINCRGHFKCSHAHHHELDPHTWLNPNNVVIMVQIITKTLANIDSQNATFYHERSKDYINKLESLNAWIINQIKLIPPSNRKLITNHDSFGYFAKQYGFATLGDVLGSSSTENVDPSASQFANLVKIIRKKNVPAIFGENIQSTVLINKLAVETKLPQPELLYTEALSKETGPAKNYIELMKHNVNILVQCLK